MEELRKRPPYSLDNTDEYYIWKDKIDSEREKLNKEIRKWKDIQNLCWFLHGSTKDFNNIEEIADYIMISNFSKTPIVMHQKMANRWVQDQRKDRIRLNTEILDKKLIKCERKGNPPGKTILKQTFEPANMLKLEKTEGNYEYYKINEPREGNTKDIWNMMKESLMRPKQHGNFEKLIKSLQSPPYGVSPRVIELYISAFFRHYRDHFKIKTTKKSHSNGTKTEFIGETIYEIVNNPDKVVIEYEDLPPLYEDYILEINEIISPDKYEDSIDGIGRLFMDWLQSLPKLTITAHDLSEPYISFLQVFKDENYESDMRDLLIERLPKALGIERPLNFWEKHEDIPNFKKIFRQVFNELNNYPDKVSNEVRRCFKEMFNVKGDTEVDVMEKIKNWYNELPVASREQNFKSDADKLIKYANIQGYDFRKRFLLDFPIELGLKEYTEWENLEETLKKYKDLLQSAKAEIEKHAKKTSLQSSVKTSEGTIKLTPAIRKTVKDDLVSVLKDLNLSKEDKISILEELLEELKK